MNKRNILTAVCALALCPAFAQTSEAVEEKVEYSTDKYKVETNRFWDNWFISAGAVPRSISATTTSSSHSASVWRRHWMWPWANGSHPESVYASCTAV